MSYPHEREVELSISRAIEMDFEHRGYKVITIPNSQHVEKEIPADHFFFAANLFKVFGLQYKRLKENPDHWDLDTDQLGRLKEFDWLFYALPVARNAIDLYDSTALLTNLKLVRPKAIPTLANHKRGISVYLESNSMTHWPIRSLKWGTLVDAVVGCQYGIPAESVVQLKATFERAEHLASIISELLAITRREPRIVLRRSFFSDASSE